MIKYSSPLTHLPLSPSFSYLVYLFSHVSLSLFDLSISKAFGYCSLSTDFLIKIPSLNLFSFGRCFGLIEVIGWTDFGFPLIQCLVFVILVRLITVVGLIGYWLNLSWIDQVVGFDLFFFPLGLDWSVRETKRQRYWKLGVQRERKNETKEEQSFKDSLTIDIAIVAVSSKGYLKNMMRIKEYKKDKIVIHFLWTLMMQKVTKLRTLSHQMDDPVVGRVFGANLQKSLEKKCNAP